MTIKNDLIELMERKSLNQTQVSRAIGMSTATVNQYLQDKYNGDLERVNSEVQAFLERTREKDKAQRVDVKFVATSASKKALEIIRMAHVDGE
ncbi:helix-turn-helix domain-containing protein, partial [Yersinia enterocolitica]